MRIFPWLGALSVAAACHAQTATLTASPVPAKRAVAPVLERRALVDGLGSAELPEALRLLRQHYIDQTALSDLSLQRAQLEGLLARLGPGVRLLARNGVPDEAQQEAMSPFRTELLDGPVGYVRLGSLLKPHLVQLDAALRNFQAKKVASVILDLRATPASSDYDLAAQVANRFVAKGRPLFTLKKPGAKDERLFTSNSDPLYAGFVVIVVDSGTAGAAEVIGAVTRLYARSMIIGTASAGQAVEYADLELGPESILRVAVAEVTPAAGARIFPKGVTPDLVVDGAPTGAERERVLKAALEPSGIAGVLNDPERIRMNEAALVAGINPEVEMIQEAQRRRGNPALNLPRDILLQRAVDVITTVNTLGPGPAK